jgi:hypothetical protein
MGVRLLTPLEVKVVSAAVRPWVGRVGEYGGEEAVGPVFGVAAGVGRPRPVKWCTRLSASSSPDVYAAAAIAITSSGSSTGSASALAIDSALM